MSKNVKNAVVLGVLFLVIMLVYGKNIFKSTPSSSRQETAGLVQPGTETPAVPGAELTEEIRKPKRIPPGWGRDPFIAEETGPTKLTKVQQPRKLYLSGIANKEGLYLAIIDGKVVKKGDMIEGREITNITEDAVILKRDNKIEILKLRGGIEDAYNKK